MKCGSIQHSLMFVYHDGRLDHFSHCMNSSFMQTNEHQAKLRGEGQGEWIFFKKKKKACPCTPW